MFMESVCCVLQHFNTDVSVYTLGNTGKLDDNQLTLLSIFFLFRVLVTEVSQE